MYHNLFTFPSRNTLICCALSFSLSLSNDVSRAHEWYRDDDFSTRDASSNVTQRVDELLLHQATRRATSIAVFARHARNSSHAGFPWRVHVALMHALTRARAYTRNVEERARNNTEESTESLTLPYYRLSFFSFPASSPDVLFPSG